jgi:hypothetical protein
VVEMTYGRNRGQWESCPDGKGFLYITKLYQPQGRGVNNLSFHIGYYCLLSKFSAEPSVTESEVLQNAYHATDYS